MIEELRRRLNILQKAPRLDGESGCLPLGLSAVDDVLGGGLMTGALHEIAAPSEAHMAAATGFALALSSLRDNARTLVWIAEDMTIAENGLPYGPGLDAFGLPPERLLTVAVSHRRDLMGAMEEALRYRAVGAVIGEVRGGALDPIAVRRLSLAAMVNSNITFLLRGEPQRDASTALTRWIVGAVPSAQCDRHELGSPRFAAQLIRNRRGPTASWILEWSDTDERFISATPALPVAAVSADRPRKTVA